MRRSCETPSRLNRQWENWYWPLLIHLQRSIHYERCWYWCFQRQKHRYDPQTRRCGPHAAPRHPTHQVRHQWINQTNPKPWRRDKSLHGTHGQILRADCRLAFRRRHLCQCRKSCPHQGFRWWFPPLSQDGQGGFQKNRTIYSWPMGKTEAIWKHG